MRCYFLSSSWSFAAISEALRSLDSKYLNALLEGDEDVKVIKVEYVKKTGEQLEALIRVAYKSKLGKRWSDSYVLTFTQLDSGTMVTAKRISGIGRVDPDFILECLITSLIAKRT